jgi:hypothetical protein
MSLLNAIHFDTGVIPSTFNISGTVATSNTVKRTGTYSLRISSTNVAWFNRANLMLTSTQTELYLQFGFYYLASSFIADATIFKWYSLSGVVLGTLKLDFTTRKVKIYTGDSVTLVATSTASLSALTQYVIELHILINSSTGVAALRVDTIADVSFTGNTQPGSETSVSIVAWGNMNNSGSIASDYIYIDDIIINSTAGSYNNSWPNGAKVYYLTLDGDGLTKQWSVTPAGLTHFTAIDEVAPSSADYIRAAITNLVDTFTCIDLPALAGSIKAVIPEIYAFKGSMDAPSVLSIGIDIGAGPEYVDVDLKIMQSQISNIWEQKPGGGSFTASDVNALQFYLKSAP